VNELIFFTHVLLVTLFVLLSVRLGKSGLTVAIVLQVILANLFVVKQTNLFGLSVTCSDVFAVGGILGLNLLQEYFGKESANQVVKISFVYMIFFLAMAQMHLWYVPALEDTAHGSFSQILSATPRIVIASLITYFLVQKLDIALFSRLKTLFNGGNLPVRVLISLLLTQFVDTVLFSFLGLFGLVAHIFDVIVMSFCIKSLVIITSAPLISFSRKWTSNVSV
jgi:uncharacterized integral membrane protein (TIGR00697 family)